MQGFRLFATAVVLGLCAVAHADSLFVNAQNLISGFPVGPNQDAVQLLSSNDPFVGANVTFLLQFGNFYEGTQPIYATDPFGPPILISPYFAGSVGFAVVDDITITDYNNTFQKVSSVERFVTITGTDTSLPDGSRILSFNPQTQSFGNLGTLLLFPLGQGYAEFSTGPFRIDAYLMQLPTTGDPAPPAAITPEPSSFILLGNRCTVGDRPHAQTAIGSDVYGDRGSSSYHVLKVAAEFG